MHAGYGPKDKKSLKFLLQKMLITIHFCCKYLILQISFIQVAALFSRLSHLFSQRWNAIVSKIHLFYQSSFSILDTYAFALLYIFDHGGDFGLLKQKLCI